MPTAPAASARWLTKKLINTHAGRMTYTRRHHRVTPAAVRPGSVGHRAAKYEDRHDRHRLEDHGAEHGEVGEVIEMRLVAASRTPLRCQHGDASTSSADQRAIDPDRRGRRVVTRVDRPQCSRSQAIFAHRIQQARADEQVAVQRAEDRTS